jgi:hypothetical protein
VYCTAVAAAAAASPRDVSWRTCSIAYKAEKRKKIVQDWQALLATLLTASSNELGIGLACLVGVL